MSRFRLQLCLATLIPVYLAACTASSPSTGSQPVASPLNPSPQIYAPLSSPAPLTPEELAQITAAAAAYQPEGRTIWFILVLMNRSEGSALNYRVTVYYSPDELFPRLQKGRCVDLNNDDLFPGSTFSIPFGPLPRPTLRPYVQISPEHSPATASIKDLPIPKFDDLPFASPDNLSEAELVSIVDYLRSFGNKPFFEPKQTRNPDGSITTVLRGTVHLDPNTPILGINANGDQITVDMGWVAGPLYGGGTQITLRRKGLSYEVVGAAMWYS